ncbi:hypothetical protein EON65_09215 [archaeon]|nr:MAG: hypothetical protein EON65_09215 [archaeon]
MSEFWSLKSLFIQAKTNPNLLGSASFQDKALEYFEKSSNIAKQKFWASLSLEARKKAAKYFVLQEVTETTNTRMSTEKDSAAVYIILNGSATLKMSDSAQERVYNTGDIFGAVDVFDRIAEGDEGESEDQFDNEMIQRPKFMTATMKKGTYLRISLADFYQHILSVDKQLPGIDEDEYAKIAEISWAELTDEDKKFIEIYKHIKEVVRKDMFDYLSCFKLIPNNSRVPSVKYYKEGNVGHHIDLHVNDPVSVFILLSGNLCCSI